MSGIALMRKFVRRTAGSLVFLGVILFGAAGTLNWPEAWIYLALTAAMSFGGGFWLACHDPALLRGRLGSLIQLRERLGSLIQRAGLVLLIAMRAVLEERTLTAELAGYADYAARFRYRLVPLSGSGPPPFFGLNFNANGWWIARPAGAVTRLARLARELR